MLQPLTIIQQQIDWLPMRNAERNPLGMLRRAIEDDWAPPASVVANEKRNADREPSKQERERDAALDAAERQRRTDRQRQLATWRTLSAARRADYYKQTVQQTTSHSLHSRLRRRRDLNNPATEVLAVMLSDLGDPVATSL